MKVFISHSTKDMAVVEEFKKLIESVGIEAYMAVYDTQPGKLLWNKIEANIKTSHLLVAVLTEEASKSEIVNQEMAIAKAHGILVVPVMEEGVKAKGLLDGIEHITLNKQDLNKAKEQVLAYLSETKKKASDLQVIGFLLLGIFLVFLFTSTE